MNDATEADAAWMRRCHTLAQEAREWGDAPVGCVIVSGGLRIAEASERVVADSDVTAHAELLAIRRACRALGTMNLSECVLFTSVEPCWMCSFAIREVKVARVVISAPVEHVGGVTSAHPLLADPDVIGWVPPPKIVWLESESRTKPA